MQTILQFGYNVKREAMKAAKRGSLQCSTFVRKARHSSGTEATERLRRAACNSSHDAPKIIIINIRKELRHSLNDVTSYTYLLPVSGVTRRVVFGGVQHPPPPKFRGFDKAETNFHFRGKYIRNNPIRIRISFICKFSGNPD
jgi:hypothetical protein